MPNLDKYIPRDENVIFRFGIGLRYIVVSSLLWSIPLGGLAFFFMRAENDSFFTQILLILLVVIIFGYVIRFASTYYFVTETKIYKVTGLGFRNVTSAQQSEIDDIKIIQGFLERILFNTGTIKFNTPGSGGFEVILPHVEAPYETKQNLYDLWDEPGTEASP